jgi:uncharacterized protein (TIGR00255 family)
MAAPVGIERGHYNLFDWPQERLPWHQKSYAGVAKMIRSMTAFACREDATEWGTLFCEIRSVNHRFLEVSVRLPEELREIEAGVRDRTARHIQRGKVECRLRFQPAFTMAQEIVLNEDLIRRLSQATRQIDSLLYNPAPVNAMDILRWPGIIAAGDLSIEPLRDRALALLETTLQELVACREREGGRLRAFVQQRLDGMQSWVAKVRTHLPAALASVRDKLVRRLADLRVEVDEERLLQEIGVLLTKADIAEELDRLDAHTQEARHVMESVGAVGRRLDFLMQELHREANTLGAKAADLDTVRAALELKVLVDQSREQVQNIE